MSATEINPFEFYLKFAKSVVLKLTEPHDRVMAAAWVRKLQSPEWGSQYARTNYLKLLLFVLQKKKLCGIFLKNPNQIPKLEEFPESQLHAIAKGLLKDHAKIECPECCVEYSTDLLEYCAVQTIPNFGVHGYYALSPEPLPKWKNSRVRADQGVPYKRSQVFCTSPKEGSFKEVLRLLNQRADFIHPTVEGKPKVGPRKSTGNLKDRPSQYPRKKSPSGISKPPPELTLDLEKMKSKAKRSKSACNLGGDSTDEEPSERAYTLKALYGMTNYKGFPLYRPKKKEYKFPTLAFQYATPVPPQHFHTPPVTVLPAFISHDFTSRPSRTPSRGSANTSSSSVSPRFARMAPKPIRYKKPTHMEICGPFTACSIPVGRPISKLKIRFSTDPPAAPAPTRAISDPNSSFGPKKSLVKHSRASQSDSGARKKKPRSISATSSQRSPPGSPVSVSRASSPLEVNSERKVSRCTAMSTSQCNMTDKPTAITPSFLCREEDKLTYMSQELASMSRDLTSGSRGISTAPDLSRSGFASASRLKKSHRSSGSFAMAATMSQDLSGHAVMSQNFNSMMREYGSQLQDLALQSRDSLRSREFKSSSRDFAMESQDFAMQSREIAPMSQESAHSRDFTSRESRDFTSTSRVWQKSRHSTGPFNKSTIVSQPVAITSSAFLKGHANSTGMLRSPSMSLERCRDKEVPPRPVSRDENYPTLASSKSRSFACFSTEREQEMYVGQYETDVSQVRTMYSGSLVDGRGYDMVLLDDGEAKPESDEDESDFCETCKGTQEERLRIEQELMEFDMMIDRIEKGRLGPPSSR